MVVMKGLRRRGNVAGHAARINSDRATFRRPLVNEAFDASLR